MTGKEERQIITEFIELYRDLPCLWDLSCEKYKDHDQKSVAWEILVKKLKTIEPDANVASAKKKIENLKSSYKRELKKVKNSKKRTGSGAHEVHKPTLWYYDLMQFLEKKDEHSRRGICTISSDDESQGNQVVKKEVQSLLEINKRRLIETAQDVLQQSKKKTNSFGVYVGEQLDSLSTHQRQIAEKLISDVIFLGKTENLNFNSRVESYNTPCPISLTHCSPGLLSPQYITPSPLYSAPSPLYNSPSPKYNSPSPQPQNNTTVPQYVIPPSVSSPINVLPLSSPLILTHSTVHSIKYSSPSHQQRQPEVKESTSSPQYQSRQIQSHSFPSQHQTQPTENPTIVQISIPSPDSPPLPETIQTDEESSQSIIECPAGTLLKELLKR